MTAVSWAIQAHPARSLVAKELEQKIGGPVDLVWDPEPKAEHRSPWRTFRHLLEATPEWATHRAQIQDDASACRGLRGAVDRIVATHPDRLIVLYVGGKPTPHAAAVLQACREDRCYADLQAAASWVPVVSTVWPVALIPELLEFVDAQNWHRLPEFVADDEIVGTFAKATRIRPLATVPSLVEHNDWTQSLVGQRTFFGEDPARVAACYIGDCDECDASEIDWENGVHH